MIAVIIAGGKGARLWPLSTADKPKHLLRLTGERSLLQNSYDRAKLITDEVYILTDESHHNKVHEQLPDIPKDKFIIEPGRRGTANCIALALAKIEKKHGEQADVAFFHADHHITDVDSFGESVKVAVSSARENNSIALVGIEPDYPATGFGYIKKGQKIGEVFKVDSFKEKPDEQTAEKYFNSGEYLWNLGLFAAPISVFKQEIKSSAPELNKAYQSIASAGENDIPSIYAKLENQPIDTALIEKAENLVVVPGKFDWMDLGSFKDLHDILPSIDELQNTVLGEDDKVHLEQTKNTVVVTHNKPVAIIGLENVIVVDTDEGLLVCHRDKVQAVKNAAQKFSRAD